MERELFESESRVAQAHCPEMDSRPLTSRRQTARNQILAKLVTMAAITSPAVFDSPDADAHPHGVESYRGSASLKGTRSSSAARSSSRPKPTVDEGWSDPVDSHPSGGLALVERGKKGTYYANKEAKRTKGYAKGGYDIGPSDPLEITAFGQRNSFIQLVLLPIIATPLDPKKEADRLAHGPMNFRIYVDDNRDPLHLPTDSDVRYLKPDGSWLTPTKGQAAGVWSAELHLENIRLGVGKHRILVESDDTHSYRVMVLGMLATEEATEDESYMPAQIGPFPCEVVYNGHYDFRDGTRGKKTGGFKAHVDREPAGTPKDSAVNVYLTRGVDAFKPRDKTATTRSTARGERGRVVMKTAKKIMPRAEDDSEDDAVDNPKDDPRNLQQCVFVRQEPPSHSTNSDPRRWNIEVKVGDDGAVTEAPEGYVARFYGNVLYVWGLTERGETEAFKGKVTKGETGTVRLERY